MGLLSFILGGVTALCLLPAIFAAYIYFNPIRSQVNRFFLGKSSMKEPEPREVGGEEEPAKWVSEILEPIYRYLMNRDKGKTVLKGFVMDHLSLLLKAPFVEILSDSSISLLRLGDKLPVIRSVTPLKAAEDGRAARFLVDLEYKGGMQFVMDGDLQTGVRVPVSLLVKVVSLRGKCMVEIPTRLEESPSSSSPFPFPPSQADRARSPVVTLCFLVGPDLQLDVEALFMGRLLPSVGSAIAAIFSSCFKYATRWPNKRAFLDLGKLMKALEGVIAAPFPQAMPIQIPETAGVLLQEQDTQLLATSSGEQPDSPSSEGTSPSPIQSPPTPQQQQQQQPPPPQAPSSMAYQGETPLEANGNGRTSIVSLAVLGPLKNLTKMVTGTADTDTKDFTKLVAFSFGIDPKDVDNFELVARSGGRGSFTSTSMKRYTTVGKIQGYLESHEGALLHLKKKSFVMGSDATSDASKILHRKRSNSIS